MYSVLNPWKEVMGKKENTLKRGISSKRLSDLGNEGLAERKQGKESENLI